MAAAAACVRMRHRVDAAARPNSYPEWPETPEHASIFVNHTAPTTCISALPPIVLWIPGPRSGSVRPSRVPLQSLLPSCGAADFTGRKPSPRDGCIRSFDCYADLFFFFTSKLFPRSHAGTAFSFCIPYSNGFLGCPVRCDVICDCFPKRATRWIRVQASCLCVDFVALFLKIDDAVLYGRGLCR